MAGAKSRVSKGGAVVLPAYLRRRYGLNEGAVVIAEPRKEGILLRAAKLPPVEIYTPERKAEFLLNNALDDEDYARARKEVRKMGLDPEHIPHERPAG